MAGVGRRKRTGLKKPAAKAGAAKSAAKPARTPLSSLRARLFAPPATLKGRVMRYGALALVLTALGASGYGYLQYRSLYAGMPALPPTEELWASGRLPALEFVDAAGETIAIRGPRYGRAAFVSELPPHVYQAFIAAEDKRFYEHDGADTTAIARAAWSNWRSGRTVSGASTITQQVVKNLVLGPEQTIRRKAQEVALARRLERRLPKDEILELYINRSYYGAGAYGLGAAAERYFGVAPAELSIAQAAILAGLLQAPSRFALDRNMDGAQERQRYVLGQMVEAGYISDVQKAVAEVEVLEIQEPPPEPAHLGHVLDMAQERVGEMLPDAPGDLVVTLTLDTNLQLRANNVVRARIKEAADPLKVSEAAILLMRPDGAVRALIGGVDYEASKFNRATQARRQPGSAFKPFVFAAALEAGADPYDLRFDEPVQFDDWKPTNYVSGAYLGPVTLSEALAKSLNTVSATLGQELGEEAIISLARRFGVTSDMRPLPSIALGSQEMTLLELVRAYGVFARGGERVDPYLIGAIHDSRGEELFARPDFSEQRVFSADLSRQMTAMMSQVILSGTGGAAAIPRWPAAGKTGTSQDWRDAWFVGFTANLVGGVWVGNDDDSPMNEVSGGGLPAEIWAAVMGIGLEGQDPTTLAGAETGQAIGADARTKIDFYRELSGAFRTVAPSRLASADDGSASQR